ncbi:MAG: RHS repeat-associated core domain-containing protein [Aquisalinus sp.]|nr:RHS repeat-associated core domain-containing protein [Aquisalinus sp.]
MLLARCPCRAFSDYGEKLNSVAGNLERPAFTGHIHDDGSLGSGAPMNGLTYMQARFYAPVIGRFLSIDPVGFVESGNNPAMFNRYSYAWNDPVNLTDPDGREPLALNDPTFLYGLPQHPTSGEAAMLGSLIPGSGVVEAMASGSGAGGIIGAMATEIPGLKQAKVAKKVTGSVKKLSQRAATRQAKREAGIPTSQQAHTQSSPTAPNGDKMGREMTFKTPSAGGGTETKGLTISRDQRGAHKGIPTVEAGTVKTGANGAPQRTMSNRLSLQNKDKKSVEFDPND